MPPVVRIFTLVVTLHLSALPLLIAQQLPARTALDDYIEAPDDSYRWEVVSETQIDGMKIVVIDMVSQTWRSEDEVNRTQWQHWLKLAIPDNVTSPFAFLTVGGGSNRPDQTPSGPDEATIQIARATGTVAAELGMVPNQPLIFHGDGKPRYEDDLIGYTWDQFLQTGDPAWPARNPMVKSVIRAMDTITAVMASDVGNGAKVDRFVVAGGSKRGWTTWLAGLDPRVEAIVPIVIDVLNTERSMRHHFAAYGYWAPAIGNYVQHRIMERMEHPRMQELYELVDPYYYRHRLDKPKYIVNAAGDQFFLPDSSQFYFDDLIGAKRLRYVPNGDHGLDGTDAIESIAAFYWLIVNDQPVPKFSWTTLDDRSIRVQNQDPPSEVRLWKATNPETRDFRVETLGREFESTPLKDQGGGVYVATVDDPESGWTAYFVELTYNLGPMKLKMTTDVKVVPDVLPFADKSPTLPARITVAAEAPSAEKAMQIVRLAEPLAKQHLQVKEFRAVCSGTECYFNWIPQDQSDRNNDRRNIETLMRWLQQQDCGELRIQLESGDEITGAGPY